MVEGRHVLRRLLEAVVMDVARTVAEHLARMHPNDELCTRVAAEQSSDSSIDAVPCTRTRRLASKSMHTIPTFGFTRRFPIERYRPLPS